MWLTVSELWEFTVRASYIVFFFVNNENSNLIKETASRVFTDLLSNSPNVRLGFHHAKKALKTCLIS